MDIFPWTWAEICDKSTIFLDPDLGFVPLMATSHGGEQRWMGRELLNLNNGYVDDAIIRI